MMLLNPYRFGGAAPGGSGYDIGSATFDTGQDVSVLAQDTDPAGLFFKPDGTKFYICGFAGNTVEEYNMSTPWDISSGSISHNQSLDVNGTATGPTGVFFKEDGLKMYVQSDNFNYVRQYALSSAWDISTAVSGSTGSVVYDTGLFMSTDGKQVYVCELNSVEAVKQYTLGTAWDISTIGGIATEFRVDNETNTCTGVCFSENGMAMYTTSYTGDAIYQYDLSVAWDITTAGYIQLLDVSGEESWAMHPFFGDSGTYVYVIGKGNDAIHRYSL